MKTYAPLAAQDISHTYGERDVLRNVSLALEEGEILGLVGRNGAGKSTLIQILVGMLQPTHGEGRVFGAPSLQMVDAQKLRIGYVPQQPESMTWLRVGEMMSFIGNFYPAWDADFVSRSLERAHIPTDKLLSALSPGERQRVAIARALAYSPDLLVLDEPAAALDPVARRDLLGEIATRAADHGTTVLFSTHIVSDLERVASRVAFLHAGELMLDTPMDDLKERHLRLRIPANAAQQLTGRVPGEIARRNLPDGAVSVVVVREEGRAWPAIVDAPSVMRDVLSLEDLFIEVEA